ncbi:MAG TPA: hypothetical protein VFV99_21915, partial [Kofleriaceae bacterium]|nr:hypothetical protein [Kofleriaceae bacterium]
MLRPALAATVACSLISSSAFAWPTFGQEPLEQKPANSRAYERVVQKVANMVGDERAYTMASSYKL